MKRNRIHNPTFVHAVAILFFIEFARSGFVFSYLPAYAASELQLSASVIGIAISIHYVSDTLIKCVAGFWLDRLNPRLILYLSLACVTGGLLLANYAGAVWSFVAGTALIGIGVSPIWLICLSKVNPVGRASQMGMLYTAWFASLGGGLVITNFLIDHDIFTAFTVLMAMCCIGCVAALPFEPEANSALNQIPLKRQWIELRTKLVRMKPLIPGMVLQTTAGGMLVPILPGFAANTLELNYSQYSLLLLVGGICATALLIPMGKWTDRLHYRAFLVIGFGAITAFLFGITFIRGLAYILPFAVLIGIAFAAAMPAWNALMARYVPQEQPGMGWGVLSSVEGIGVMIGPAIGGAIAGIYGETATVWISAGLLGVIALFYLFFTPVEDKEGSSRHMPAS